MEIKKSINAGAIIERLIEEEGVTVNQLSFDIGVSPQMGSHLKKDRRPLGILQKEPSTYLTTAHPL